MADAVEHEQVAHVLDTEAHRLALSVDAGDPWPPLARAKDLLPEAARVLAEATEGLTQSVSESDEAQRLRKRLERAQARLQELQTGLASAE